MGDFQPAAPTAWELVEQTAQAHWFFLRVQKQWDLFEAGTSLNPLEWSEAEWKTRERLGRYRTAAERSFHRALTAIEARRKSRMAEFAQETRLEQAAQRIELTLLHRREQVRIANEKLALRKAELAQRAVEAERKAAERAAERAEAKKVAASATKKKKKNGGFGVAEQWLEIRVTEGVTTTEFIPGNDELLEEIAKAVEQGDDEPEMVYRRMNFPDGVPPEYAWTNSHDVASCELNAQGKWCEECARFLHAAAGIQRMTFATWKDVIALEAQQKSVHDTQDCSEMASGPSRFVHAGPTGVGNLPRPKERGGDMAFAEMLELLGQGREES
jgi:hypothetical protein